MSERQIQEQVMRAQGYAVEIEHILENIFECDRFGFGGQINSDQIRKHPFLSITQGLAYIYAIEPVKRKKIENYIENFGFYSAISLDELLSFESSEREINQCWIQIDKENGLEQVEYMISEFRRVIE